MQKRKLVQCLIMILSFSNCGVTFLKDKRVKWDGLVIIPYFSSCKTHFRRQPIFVKTDISNFELFLSSSCCTGEDIENSRRESHSIPNKCTLEIYNLKLTKDERRYMYEKGHRLYDVDSSLGYVFYFADDIKMTLVKDFGNVSNNKAKRMYKFCDYGTPFYLYTHDYAEMAELQINKMK